MADHADNPPDRAIAPGEVGPRVIGWREYVALPDWGIKRLRAKADTGARTSAIDAYDIQELPDGMVRFVVVMSRKHPDRRREIIAPITRRTPVKSSLGQRHDRLFVTTTLKIGPVVKEIEVGLVSRHRMLCRMLIGRSALAGDFVVDPQRVRVLSQRKRRRPKP